MTEVDNLDYLYFKSLTETIKDNAIDKYKNKYKNIMTKDKIKILDIKRSTLHSYAVIFDESEQLIMKRYKAFDVTIYDGYKEIILIAHISIYNILLRIRILPYLIRLKKIAQRIKTKKLHKLCLMLVRKK